MQEDTSTYAGPENNISLPTYWPSAYYKTKYGKDILITTEPLFTLKKAKDQVALWAQGFQLLSAWIDVTNGNKTNTVTLF